jgi:hypothetical protein
MFAFRLFRLAPTRDWLCAPVRRGSTDPGTYGSSEHVGPIPDTRSNLWTADRFDNAPGGKKPCLSQPGAPNRQNLELVVRSALCHLESPRSVTL